MPAESPTNQDAVRNKCLLDGEGRPPYDEVPRRTLPLPLLMTLMLLAGICFTIAAAMVALSVRRLPEGSRCPECGIRTHAVVAPRWIRWSRIRVDTRWCMQCGWEGLARRGSVSPFGGAVKHVWRLPRARDLPEGRHRPNSARWPRRGAPPLRRPPEQSEAPPEDGSFRWQDEGEN